MILDIGCGEEYQGDVNLDLFMYDSPHTIQCINPKYIPCFINGDAQHLPIRDNVFNIVYSKHVIEHLDYPLDALKEMNRVSNNKIIVIVPNNPIIKEHYEHLYSWSYTSFYHILNRYMKVKKIIVTSTRKDFGKRFTTRIANLLPFALRRKTFRWLSSIYGFELTGICQTSNTEIKEYSELNYRG